MRKEQVDTIQKKIEPLIHHYFSLTEQEITLVEDTIRVFIPSSTPTTRWSKETVSLEPPERSNVPPYADEGLGAYARALTKTLNTWAEMEGSIFRVCAEGGADDRTGLAMITLELISTETAYRESSLSRRLADVLAKLQKVIGDNSRTLGYERDLVIFRGKQVTYCSTEYSVELDSHHGSQRRCQDLWRHCSCRGGATMRGGEAVAFKPLFPAHHIPVILLSLLRAGATLRKKADNEFEDRITNRLFRTLVRMPKFRDGPLGIHLRSEIPHRRRHTR